MGCRLLVALVLTSFLLSSTARGQSDSAVALYSILEHTALAVLTMDQKLPVLEPYRENGVPEKIDLEACGGEAELVGLGDVDKFDDVVDRIVFGLRLSRLLARVGMPGIADQELGQLATLNLAALRSEMSDGPPSDQDERRHQAQLGIERRLAEKLNQSFAVGHVLGFSSPAFWVFECAAGEMPYRLTPSDPRAHL